MHPTEFYLDQRPKTLGDFGRKSSNLERSIQKIKHQKSRLMAEIRAPDPVKSRSPTILETVVNKSQSYVPTISFTTYDGVLPLNGTYICDQCNSNERTPFQLCEHIAIYHSPPDHRIWKCVYCNTIFGRRGGLRRHVQMVHMQMMHKCPIENCTHPGYKCTKALNAHLKTHDHPFECSQCDKKFLRKVELVAHQTIHPAVVESS